MTIQIHKFLIFSLNKTIKNNNVSLDSNNEHLPEDECKEIITLTESSGSIHLDNYPSPYRTGCVWEWTIIIPERTSLHLTIEDADIDSLKEDQLFIHTGGKLTI